MAPFFRKKKRPFVKKRRAIQIDVIFSVHYNFSVHYGDCEIFTVPDVLHVENPF